MRRLLPILLPILSLAACQCGPEAPTPVTLRVKNVLPSPIFVEASDGRMGLSVQRQIGGAWVPLDETLPCECLSCDQVCAGCECDGRPPPNAEVMKIGAGETFEREWRGAFLQDAFASCPDSLLQGPPCLREEIPALDEPLRLELCYAPSATGVGEVDAGVVVPGTLPKASKLCVQKAFKVVDGLVEISPVRGAECSGHDRCTGEGELCFDGACTTACPATGFPPLGAEWQVRIPEPVNQDFFTQEIVDRRTVYTGTGRLSGLQYAHNTMTLSLEDSGRRGEVAVTLPPGIAVALTVGQTLSVRVVDASSDENPENRGVVIRDGDGTLLLAAETGQLGRVLSDGEIAPVSLARGTEIVACEHTECGKNLFYETRFTIGGAGGKTVSVPPGEIVEVVAAGNTWKVVNVWNAAYAQTWCHFDDLMPWAVANQRGQGMGP